MSNSQPTPLEDAEDRLIATCEFETAVVLEAGAGTGKTAVLVARTLYWCLGKGWEQHAATAPLQAAAPPSHQSTDHQIARSVLERVLAITFTEDAAAEMSERIVLALEALQAGQEVIGLPTALLLEQVDSTQLRSRAAALNQQIERLNATTIHAWCRSLLNTYPLEAGVRPGFEVDATGLHKRNTIDAVIADWLPQAFGPPADTESPEADSVGKLQEDAIRLTAAGHDPVSLRTALEELVNADVRADDLADPYPAQETNNACAEVNRLCERLLNAIVGVEDIKGANAAGPKAFALVESLAMEAKAFDFPGLLKLMASDDPATRSGLRKLESWKKGKFAKNEAEIITAQTEAQQASEDLLQLQSAWSRFDTDLLPAAVRILKPLLQEVEQRMSNQGVLPFSELLRGAHALLVNSPEVAQSIRSRLDQVMVDEFQDTDPLQYEIVSRLVLEGPSKSRPGLFLVGDPKQSIYGFRNADLNAYEAFVAKLNIEPRTLNVNFRSVPAILKEVERIIGPAMVYEEGIQPPFQTLLPAPHHQEAQGFIAHSRSPVEHWVTWGPRPPSAGSEKEEKKRLPPSKIAADPAREVEAAAIASDIHALVASGDCQYGDFALLFRAKSKLGPYLDALRAWGIPFEDSGDRSFYQRREITEATALVTAILDPDDHVSLLAVLRSPLVGVPDAALLPLWRDEAFASLLAQQFDHVGFGSHLRALNWQPIDEAIDRALQRTMATGVLGLSAVEGFGMLLKDAARQLVELRHGFLFDAATTWVDRLKAAFFNRGTEAARYLGAYRVSNLERFFSIVEHALAEESGGADAVIRSLRQAQESKLAREERAAAPEDANAVKIMTIHGSKGLDFTHVYLPDLHHKFRPQSIGGAETEVGRLKGAGTRLEYRLLGMPSLKFAEVHAQKKTVNEAERLRVLYVALTRAKQRLVFTGTWPEGMGATHSPIHSISQAYRRHPESEISELLATWNSPLAPEAPPEPYSLNISGTTWRHLGMLPQPEPPTGQDRGNEPAEHALSPSTIQEFATRLQHDREIAFDREKRRRISPITEAKPGSPTGFPNAPSSEDETALARASAQALGTIWHRVMEALPLSQDLDELSRYVGEFAAGGDSLAEALVALGVREPDEIAQASAELATMLDSFCRSELLRHWSEIAPQIAGREVPILLPTTSESHSSEASNLAQPLQAYVGAIDLLVHNPDNNSVIVVDYKSDRFPPSASESDIAVTLKSRHGAQMQLYLDGVASQFGPSTSVKGEFWLLRRDLIVSF